MFVNDREEIGTKGYRLSPSRYGYRLKILMWLRMVFVSLNLPISLREEVEFQSNSDALDTHNPNTQGGIKPCMCM